MTEKNPFMKDLKKNLEKLKKEPPIEEKFLIVKYVKTTDLEDVFMLISF